MKEFTWLHRFLMLSGLVLKHAMATLESSCTLQGYQVLHLASQGAFP